MVRWVTKTSFWTKVIFPYKDHVTERRVRLSLLTLSKMSFTQPEKKCISLNIQQFDTECCITLCPKCASLSKKT